MNFPKDFLNKIICGNNIEVMKDLPNESIDSVITSPPFNMNIRKTTKSKSDNWNAKSNNSKLQKIGYANSNDNLPEKDYIAQQKQILAECFRVIKNNGCIFYNHRWRVQQGLLQQRSEIVEGLPLRQIIIWKKAGGFNFNEGYFLPTYEVIYLIAKPDFKLPPKVNHYGDVWEITQQKGSWHPAPFPLELAKRCVEATSGNLILDPYAGSSTTCLAAKQQGKNYIGIDISEEYCKKSEERLKIIKADI